MRKITLTEKEKGFCLHAECDLTIPDFNVSLYLISDSPRKKLEEKPLIPMTPSMNKKEPNCILPPTGNKNLPPKPVQNPNNNVSYKLPPKPSPLIPSKQNNSVDYSRPSSRERGQQLSQRERSK